MSRLMKDLAVDRAKNPEGAMLDRWDQEEEENEDEDDTDINIIDRSECLPSNKAGAHGCALSTVALTIL